MQNSEVETPLESASALAAATPVNGAATVKLLHELYARVLDSMTDGVSITSEDGLIIYTNPSTDRLFGYGPGELPGQHVSVQNACSTDESIRLVAQIPEHLKVENAWKGEWRNKKKDGCEFQTFARITSVNLPDKRFFVWVQEDITARKRSEEELQRRTEEPTDFIENGTVGLRWVGPEGTILWANQAELELLGHNRSEYIGRKIADFHVDQDVIEDILQRLAVTY